MSTPAATRRYHYIDSLRGFTMLLVVYSHVLVYMCHQPSAVNTVFILGRMPLFFFISGYFAWSGGYDKATFHKRLRRRLTRQLYPTLLVMTIFALTLRRVYADPLRNLDYAFHDQLKFGYWFTISLVEVFIVFAVTARIIHMRSIKRRSALKIMGVITFVSALPLLSGWTSTPPDIHTLWGEAVALAGLGKTLGLAPYFFMGVMARMGGETFRTICSTRVFLQTALTSTAVFGALTLSRWCGAFTGLVSLLSGMSALSLIFAIFSIMRHRLVEGSPLADNLAMIGRNTLPVYLFHYFIVVGLAMAIPDFCKALAAATGNPLTEIPVIGGMAIAVTLSVIGIDHLIKRIPVLHRVIFAV